jgi:hypothetical protein
LRVHVIPIGLDYDRIVSGLHHYGADRIYLIRGHKEHPVEKVVQKYVDRLRKTFLPVRSSNNIIEKHIDIFSPASICKTVFDIMDKERDNELYFCISSSTKLMTTYLLFAVWGRGKTMKNTPKIYYVNPAEYVHEKIMNIARDANRVLKETRKGRIKTKQQYDVLRALNEQVRTLFEDGMSRGLSKNPFYEIPFAAIELPSEEEVRVLSFIKKYEDRLDSVKSFVKRYVAEVEGKKIDDLDLVNKHRARLNYHLTNLENLMVIKRERVGKKVRLRLTELGNVFVE